MWTARSGLRSCVRPYNLAWLEEPIHSHDMNGIRRLKDMGVAIPIAFGESMRIYYEYETYIEKGVDHVQPSLGRMTRMDDIIRIRDLAREKGVKFTSGGRIYLNAIFAAFTAKMNGSNTMSRSAVLWALTPWFQPEEKNGASTASRSFRATPANGHR